MPDFDASYPSSAHGWGALNVKSFGAVGNGAGNDGPALQACFDAAWGPKEAPHGYANRHLNRAVYVPPGNYLTQMPLYITGVQGGKLFGDGASCTQISYAPGFTTGTFWRPSETAPKLTPTLCMNRCAHFVLDSVQLSYGGAPDYPANSCCIDICNIGSAGGVEAESTMHQFFTTSIGGGTYGVVVGYQDSGIGNANGAFYDTNFGAQDVAGLILFSPSALNWSVFGGGVAGICAEDVFHPTELYNYSVSTSTFVPGGDPGNYGAGYSVVQGQISFLCALSNSQNGWDFINAGGNTMTIQSGSCESAQVMATAGNSVIAVGALVTRNTNPLAIFFDMQSGGMCVAKSCSYFPNSSHDGYTAHVGSVGRFISDNLEKGDNPWGYKGSPGGVVWFRSARPFATEDLFSGFTGQVAQLVPDAFNGTLLSAMSAAAKFKGLSRIISDATAATPGTDVVGGGTKKVLAYCTGTAWRIIGPA